MKTSQDNVVNIADQVTIDRQSLPNIVVSTDESQRRIQQLHSFVNDVMEKGVDEVR